MPPQLSGVRGPLTGRTFALGDQPLTIGRASDNLVVIASPRASRHHAHIRREGATFVIYDLGSANGTLVNGQRVQRAVLQPGDLIDIGDEVFRFEAGYQQDATLLSAPQAQPPAYPPQAQSPAYPPQAQPPAYPPQAQPSSYPSQPYPPQGAAPPRHQPPPVQGHVGYGTPTAPSPMYVPPPPRAQSGGRSCLLVILLLLALVCVAGAAGAALFRDRLRDIPGIGELPGVGGYTPSIAPPPVHTGSATVGSGQAAAISMPNGPMIEVPHGAVPPNPDGTPGTLTFSIRPAPDQPVSLPAEMALSGPLYQFEPEGVTFAVPVRITLPIPAGTDPARVMGLVTRDAASGEWVTIAGTVDAAARTVSAEVTHFSPYGVYSYTGDDPGAWQRRNGGWFVLDNPGVQGDGTYPLCERLPRSVYVNVCIQNATLVDPGLSFHLPPDNLLAIGQRSKPLQAWLPAGTYRVVHYIFMSEINPGNPFYLPCRGWWVKPPQVITLQPNQTIRFERFAPEDGIFMDSFDTRTCTGTPASPTGGTEIPPQPPVTVPPSVTPQTNLPSDQTPSSTTPTLARTPAPDPTAVAYARGFAGQWSTKWGDMTCRVEGANVYCEYTHDQGKIHATLSADGKTMEGQWSEYPSYSPPRDAGRVTFTLSDDGNAINGEWWYGNNDYGGVWTGSRVGSGQSPAEETPSTCTQEVELINNRYLGACGMSDTQTFDLARSVFVTRIRVWHYPDKTGTDTPYVTITGPNGYRFSGNTTKGSCYAGWCEALVTLNQNLSPGTYTLSIPSVSICTDPSGKTTLVLYGCGGADSP